MKTNIRSLVAGGLAGWFGLACVTAQAQTPVTGWGAESDQSSGATLVETPAVGAFVIPGTVTGNYEMRAMLPSQISLANVGDTITFSGTFIFTNTGANIGGQAFRMAILDTNGSANVGTLSGGIWTHAANPTNWLGYLIDFGTGDPAIVAGRAGGSVKDWDSTSGDYYNLTTLQGAAIPTGPAAGPDTYVCTMSVQRVSANFMNVFYTMTNVSGTYSNNAAKGFFYDDGSLVSGKIGVSTTKFNAVGFFMNGSVAAGSTFFEFTNITVAFANNRVTGWTNLVVDDFDPSGTGSARYSSGQLIDVWTNWFGTAWVTNTWDSTDNASGGATGSGSLQIQANWANGSQFFVYDQGNGINPALPGLNLSDFSCDVQFDPSSPTTTTGGNSVFGHLQIGTIVNNTFQVFSNLVTGFDIAATNTAWVHINVPISALNYSYEGGISNVVFKIDGNWYSPNLASGTTLLRVDNVQFIESSSLIGVVLSNPPPVLAIQKATPGLRIFAGSTLTVNDREELATADQSQSWIGGGAVSYSFTLLDYPANIGQTHIFLVPVNTSGQATLGNAGTVNQYIEYQASNTLWMVINPAGSNVTASVQWKTNTPNANPNITALTITNHTAVGTWKLAFNSPSSGTLTAPGASPAAFTIADPNVATDFANPLVAYFGLQPNSLTGEGQYEDWASISVSGVAGTQESENFTSETSFNPNGYWANNSASTSSLQFVPANGAYWVNWTLPANGFGVGTASAVAGSANTPSPWMLPEYFNNYSDGNTLPNQAAQGTKSWVVVPSTCLPTVDGSQGGTPSAIGFFKLFNPTLAN
jgi:hypothetical protein